MVCVALLVLVSGAHAQLPAGHGGAATCACIDPFPNISAVADPRCPLDRPLRRRSDGVCFPSSYGARGCDKYDGVVEGTSASNTPECTPTLAVPAPLWCEASWCYVDPGACERPHGSSNWFSADTALTYSYEACNNVNQYDDSRRSDYLNGRKLRASFPGDSSSGYTITTVAEGAAGIGGTNRDGSIVRFFTQARDHRRATAFCNPLLTTFCDRHAAHARLQRRVERGTHLQREPRLLPHV